MRPLMTDSALRTFCQPSGARDQRRVRFGMGERQLERRLGVIGEPILLHPIHDVAEHQAIAVVLTDGFSTYACTKYISATSALAPVGLYCSAARSPGSPTPVSAAAADRRR